MKKHDFSMYGMNKRGKKALCETCTKNNWYCPVRPRYYQCKSYIKKEKEVIMNIKEGKTIDLQKAFIEKACEWLSDIDFDMEYWNFENGFSKEEFIEDFKKAMEE